MKVNELALHKVERASERSYKEPEVKMAAWEYWLLS